jgi:hypothetical protein
MVAAFVPGVAIFNALKDASCFPEMAQQNCHGEAVCWYYDLDKYRYISLGTAALFNLFAFAGFACVHWLVTSTGAKVRDNLHFTVSPLTAGDRSTDDCSVILGAAKKQDSEIGILNLGLDSAILRETNF